MSYFRKEKKTANIITTTGWFSCVYALIVFLKKSLVCTIDQMKQELCFLIVGRCTFIKERLHNYQTE